MKAETEQPHLIPDPMGDVEPATLAGHGHIGPHLLMYFLCVSDLTAFVMKAGGGWRQDQILNVGRTQRLATMKQRRAVLARQKGICATPGRWDDHKPSEARPGAWAKPGSDGAAGRRGTSRAPHQLVHRNMLHITGNAVDGFTFTNHAGQPLRHRRRASYHQAA